jgi:hypothetical protein
MGPKDWHQVAPVRSPTLNSEEAENSLPSHGTMMKAIQESFAGEEWDRNYPQRLKETMY